MQWIHMSQYTALIEWVCGDVSSYVGPACLEAEHQEIKDELLNQFISTPKIGGETFLYHIRKGQMRNSKISRDDTGCQ